MIRFSRLFYPFIVSLIFLSFFYSPKPIQAQVIVIVEIEDALDPMMMPDPGQPSASIDREFDQPQIDLETEGEIINIRATHPVSQTQVLDLQGRRWIKDQQSYKRAKLKVAHLPQGIYLIQLQTSKGLLVQKIRR